MSFASKLKEIRESVEMTQTELAERAGLSRAGIAQIETGRRKPTLETAKKIATALGVSMDELINEEVKAEKEKPKPKKSK